jgi:probable HAF family extracellular repeat protein
MKCRLLVCTTLLVVLTIPVKLRLAAQEQQEHPRKLQRYTITDLGTLGGTFSQANGINNRGWVTGFSTPPGDAVLHAFRWQNGVITDLGTLGGPNSATPDDNHLLSERGTVVGFSDTSVPDPNGEDFCAFITGFGNTTNTCLPFVWRDGVMKPLPLLGGNNGMANAVNNRGEVAGVAENDTPDPNRGPPLVLHFEPVIWISGQAEQLPTIQGDQDGLANSVNDNAQAVGFTGPCFPVHAVLWQKGKAIDLGNLGGAESNIAIDINNKGQVVGVSDLAGDTTHHAFLWQNDVMSDLGTILGLPVSLANGINNKGQIVGFSQDLNGDVSSTVAWLWQNGVMTDLNTLIPPDSPWFLIEALGINDRGQIAGPAFNTSTGDFHGYLATPCGEGNEGCGDEATSATSTRRSNSTLTVAQRLAIRRMMQGSRRGFAQRSRIPGLQAPKD